MFIDEGLEAAPNVAVEHFLLALIDVVAADAFALALAFDLPAPLTTMAERRH